MGKLYTGKGAVAMMDKILLRGGGGGGGGGKVKKRI